MKQLKFLLKIIILVTIIILIILGMKRTIVYSNDIITIGNNNVSTATGLADTRI